MADRQHGPADGEHQEPQLVSGELADHLASPTAPHRAKERAMDRGEGRLEAAGTWRIEPGHDQIDLEGPEVARHDRVGDGASSAEMTDTTLEASMIRMNWLPSAGNTARSAGNHNDEAEELPGRQPEHGAGFDLNRGNGLDAGAHDLRRVGAEADAIGRNPPDRLAPDRRQPEVDEEDLHQERVLRMASTYARARPRSHRRRDAVASAPATPTRPQHHGERRQPHGEPGAEQERVELPPDDAELEDVPRSLPADQKTGRTSRAPLPADRVQLAVVLDRVDEGVQPLQHPSGRGGCRCRSATGGARS